MLKKSINYQSYVEKVKSFKELGWVSNQLHLMKRPNFWTILEFGEKEIAQGKSAHETRTSRMIRWMLDANETHNLGNIFAQKLIEVVEGEYAYSPNKNKAIKCFAEYENIDVLYQDFSQKMCVAIEVKQYAKEGKSTGYDSQLDKYEKIVSNLIEKNDPDIRPYYIFLTPTGEEPSNKNWVAIKYKQLIEIIDQVCKENVNESVDAYKEDTLKVLSDFNDDLQRTLDFFEKDPSAIKDNFSKEERELTLELANEIEHGTDSKHIDQLLVFAPNEEEELQNLILIIKDFMYTQNHSPNDGVRLLMRKIYNYLTAGEKLNTEQIVDYKKNETKSPLRQDLIERSDLNLGEIQLTSGRGQGLYIYAKDHSYAIYFSGDTHGNFPNDGIQLLTYPEKTKIHVDKTIGKKDFHASYDLLLQDKLMHRNDGEVTVEQLMEQYVMKVIKELDKMKVNMA